MSQQFLFRYDGSEPGYCRTDFKRPTVLKSGMRSQSFYCVLLGGEGLHTSTPDWREPCSPISEKLLPFCKFERVPSEDSTSRECNEWIEENTGGFIGDFKIDDWVTIPSGLGGKFTGQVTGVTDEKVHITIQNIPAVGDYAGRPWTAPKSETVHTEKLK